MSTGSLQGYIFLQGETDHSGIIVQIIESEKLTTTDKTGKFVFSDLTVGVYNIKAVCHGWTSSQQRTVKIATGETTNLNPISLEKPKGDLDGYIYLEGAAENAHEGTRVEVIGTEHADITRISGYFQINDLEVGVYQVDYIHEGYVPARSHVFTIKTGSLSTVRPVTLVPKESSEAD